MSTATWASWLITCKCQPEDYDKIVTLAAEMSAHFEANEPRTTHFEWSVSDDHSQVHIHERYADSEQALAHMGTFGEKFGERFMSLLTPQAVVVYGHPSSALSSALEGLSPVHMIPFEGFAR
ncbi:MAG: hypothetical protein ACOVNL_11295 [Prochlorococcaceae cyanobacterium]|jgi:hypothetical protein